MTTGADQVEVLTARELSPRIGKSRRTILEWADQGCPHTVEVRRGRPCKLFVPAQVDVWRCEHGRDGTPPDAAVSPADSPDAGEPPPSLLGVPLGSVADLVRDRLRALETLSTGRDPANAQRVATAIKNLSGELRAIEDAQFKAAERAGKFIARDRVEMILVELVSQFVADLDTLAVDIPRDVAKRMEGEEMATTDYVGLQRVMGQVVRATIDHRRDERARSMDALASDLEVGG